MSHRSCLFLSAIALVLACSAALSGTEPARESTRSLQSTLADDNVEVAVCKLELDCCGNLNCAPAPCPIVCL